MFKSCYYARVSTDSQREEGTIKSQIEELKQQIVDDGGILVGDYVDDGWSGARIDRPGLDRLRADAKTDKFDSVYFLNTDRIARESAYQNIILSELIKNKKRIVINGKNFEDNPESKFHYTVLGAVSELEKAKIVERTTRGRLFKARQGIIMSSIAPYGYDRIPKKDDQDARYSVNESEAEVVRLIFNLYDEGESIRGVCKELERREINSRTSKLWSKSSIARILSNTTYIGTTYYNKYECFEVDNRVKYRSNQKTGRRFKDKKEWIGIEVPSIIDKGLFYSVQKKRDKHKNSYRPKKNVYLLTGLLKCECGSPLTAEVKNKFRYYRCNNRHKTFPLPRECNSKMVKMGDLDKAVLDKIAKLIITPKLISKHVELLQNKVSRSKEDAFTKADKLNSLKNKINNQRSRIIDLYSEGILSKDDLNAKLSQLSKKENLIKNELEALSIETRVKEDKTAIKKTIDDFCEIARIRYNNLDIKGKKHFLSLLVDEIVYSEKRALIKGFIPHLEVNNNSPSGYRSQHSPLWPASIFHPRGCFLVYFLYVNKQ